MSPLPLILFPTIFMVALKQKNWILFCPKSQQLWRMLVPQLIRPWSQFIAYQSTDTIINCSLQWMSDGKMHSKGVLSSHTLLSHTLTETIIDWSCFNEAPTCSMCNQEDEAQMRGHWFITWTWKTAQEGFKFTVSLGNKTKRTESFTRYAMMYWVEWEGVDKCWRQRQLPGANLLCGGMSNEWWWQWRKTCIENLKLTVSKQVVVL